MKKLRKPIALRGHIERNNMCITKFPENYRERNNEEENCTARLIKSKEFK